MQIIGWSVGGGCSLPFLNLGLKNFSTKGAIKGLISSSSGSDIG